MQGWFSRLMAAAVVGTVAELLPPAGERDNRALRLIVSLLMLCIVITPLMTVIGRGSGELLDRLDAWYDALDSSANAADGYAAQTMAYIRAAGAEAAEREIAALLAERFGLPPDCCRAEITLGDDGVGGVELCGMKIYLHGRAIFADAAEIEAYLAALFGGRVIVVIE